MSAMVVLLHSHHWTYQQLQFSSICPFAAQEDCTFGALPDILVISMSMGIMYISGHATKSDLLYYHMHNFSTQLTAQWTQARKVTYVRGMQTTLYPSSSISKYC